MRLTHSRRRWHAGRRSIGATDRQAFLTMNWKCLLVGLVLVFPGTLVSVEGRYFSEKERVARERDGLYKALYNLFEDQHEVERYNSQPDVAAPAVHKKQDTNNNPPQADIQMQEEAGAAGKTKAVEMPAEKVPAPSPTRHQGISNQEISKAVQLPHASRQSQKASSHATLDNGFGAPSTVFILVVAGCTVLAAVGIVGAGVCWYKYHKSAKAASVVDYPAYGVTGPTKDRVPSPGDRKLAHSAQMYHYQHQKQQMMALQSASSGEMKHDGSDDESVEDNDDADYTVYECPGLAPTGEMEVKNPLFCGDETPSTPANDETRPTPPEY